jgi:hypothetical protein
MSPEELQRLKDRNDDRRGHGQAYFTEGRVVCWLADTDDLIAEVERLRAFDPDAKLQARAGTPFAEVD